MFTAATYIAVSIALAILAALARGESHANVADAAIFRYPSIYRWVALVGVAFWIAVTAIVYVTFETKPTGAKLWLYLGVNCAVELLFLWGFVAIRRFYIEVHANAIYVGDWRGRRCVPLQEVRRVRLVDGGRGGQELSAFDAGGNILLRASSTLQDYEDLVALVRQRLPKRSGILYEHRDYLGKWSQE